MKKDFFNFIRKFLLRYSIYFGILYLLYDNQLQLKSLFFNPYIKIILFILILCCVLKFIKIKTKFYYFSSFLKYYFPILCIITIFIFFDIYFINKNFICICRNYGLCFFLERSLMYIVIMELFCRFLLLLIDDKDLFYIVSEFTEVVYGAIVEVLKASKIKSVILYVLDKLNYVLNKLHLPTLNVKVSIIYENILETLSIIFKYPFNPKLHKLLETDEPIKIKEHDKLGRKNFVENIKDIFEKDLKTDKGMVVLLSAGWGEGKSSCINLLKESINKDIFEFIKINPWFNDTKENLLNAVFGKINNFAKDHHPYKSLKSEFNDIIKLSTIKIPEIPIGIDLNQFTTDENIQNKVKEVGDILKEYSKRIIVVFDDIDRLAKNNILYILQIVQMFREYTNLIFILSCNYEKVEQILCETAEPCLNKKNIINERKTALYYKNYIEKICTYTIYLPKVYDTGIIKNELLLKIEQVVNNIRNMQATLLLDFFKNLREVKRFFNMFYTKWKIAKDFTNLSNLFNITVLEFFHKDLFNLSFKDRDKFFYRKRLVFFNLKTSKYEEEELDEFNTKVNDYFNDLMKKYGVLPKLFYSISPLYHKLHQTDLFNGNLYWERQEPDQGGKSYFSNINYLSSYFDFNNSLFSVFEEKMKEFSFEHEKAKRDLLIKNFLSVYKKQYMSLLEYMCNPNFQTEINKEIFYCIVEIFVKNSLDFDREQQEYINYDRIAYFIDEILRYIILKDAIIKKDNKGIEKFYNIYEKIIIETTSPILSGLLIYKIYKRIERKQCYFEKILSSFVQKTEKHMGLLLDSCYRNQNSMTFNMCILAYLFERENFDVYYGKNGECLKVSKEIINKVRGRSSKLLSFFIKKTHLFNLFVLYSFFANLKDYLNHIKGINVIDALSIIFYMQIWGFNNIEKCAYNDEWIELLSGLKKDKNFIEKLAVENILVDNNQDYIDDFGAYEYLKNTNYSHIRPNLISIKDKEIKLLKTEYVTDIDKKFNNDDIFELERNSLFKTISGIIPDIRPDKIYYTLYYICDNIEYKIFIKTDKKILKQLQDLNNTPNIKKYCNAEFNIECKTVDEIFDECSFDIENYQKKEE